VASRLFREHGFDGIGLKDLMEGAGLTHGAFYKQFASKDDLAAQASRRALESASRRWSAAAAANPQDPLDAVIAFYLSMGHRAERMDGCPVVALGGMGSFYRSQHELVFVWKVGKAPHTISRTAAA
jgi:TetR/AcrR family transcriptional repressor of nem operon